MRLHLKTAEKKKKKRKDYAKLRGSLIKILFEWKKECLSVSNCDNS